MQLIALYVYSLVLMSTTVDKRMYVEPQQWWYGSPEHKGGLTSERA